MKKHLKKLAGNLGSTSSFFFLAIGFAMAIGASILSVEYILKEKEIANFIPEKDLVLIIEGEKLQLPQNLPQDIQDKIWDFVEKSGFELSKLKDQSKNRFAIALYKKDNKLKPLIIKQVEGFPEAKELLKNIFSEEEVNSNEKEQKINLKNGNLKCELENVYLFCSDSEELLAEVKREENKIINDPDYIKYLSETPKNYYARGFIRVKNLERYLPINTVLIYKNIRSAGFVLEHDDMSFDLAFFAIKDQKDIENKDTAKDDLVSILPKSLVFFLNGKNSKNTFNQFIKEGELHDEHFEEFTLGRLRAIMRNSYFGDFLSLEDDILPLLEDDYSIALYKEQGKYYPLIILDTLDKDFLAIKKEKIKNALIKKAELSNFEIIEKQISEDSEDTVKEVFPKDSKKIIKSEYVDNDLMEIINLEDLKLTIAQKNTTLIVSSNEHAVKEVLLKMNLPKHKRALGKLALDYPFRSFSAFDEIFAFSYFPVFREELSFIDVVSGKIVRVPDSFRLELKIKLKQ